MHVPWRFILALPCGVLLALGFFIVLLYTQLGIPTESSRWTYEIVQKKQAIAAATPGPRLLIVGGSSGLFGLNAQDIQEQTGIRTVNCSSHAGLGLNYILDLARKTAHPGDTILLSLEYEFYMPGFNYSIFDDYILARDPDYFRQMSLLDKIDMATRISFTRIQKGWRIKRTPEKVRPHAPYADALNNFGDEIANAAADRHPSDPQMGRMADALIQGLPSNHTPGFIVLRNFLAWAHAHDITVLATFPNIMYHPEYDQPTAQKTLQTITDFYTSQNVPVIGAPHEVMLPADQFFNTYYHLTREAALVRTQHLVPKLLPYLHPSH
jgi:hypothetical protein